ncbi:MAG: hypothetical protein AAF787_03925 [Chloroflexota bacterium]
MYYPDLSPYEYMLRGKVDFEKPILNVGWLEKSHEFRKGSVPPEVVKSLRRLLRYQPAIAVQTRGLHLCDICEGKSTQRVISLPGDNSKFMYLGTAELWLPSEDGSTIYAAPTMIYHYIEAHDYLPPEDFIEAIHEFDFESEWNAKEIFEELRRKLREANG